MNEKDFLAHKDRTEKELANLKIGLQSVNHQMDNLVEKLHDSGKTAEAMHKRADHQDKELSEIKETMLTKDGFMEELDTQLNKHIVRILKTVMTGLFVTGTGALTAWFIHLFGLDK